MKGMKTEYEWIQFAQVPVGDKFLFKMKGQLGYREAVKLTLNKVKVEKRIVPLEPDHQCSWREHNQTKVPLLSEVRDNV